MRITNQLQNRQNLLNYQSSAAKNYDSIEKLSAHMKITKPYEDVGIYVDATRLDYEATTLEQIKEATTKASEFAKNTDQTLNDFADTLDSFKVKLIQAANSGEHSTTSRVAIANDLKAMRDQLVSISNTAINGQYLFSGTAVDTKPISADGTYNGNGNNIEVLAGSNLTVPFNIPGEGLFLGRDNDYAKQVTTNITLINKHEELNPQTVNEEYMRLTDEIYKFIGTDYRTSAKIAADGKMNYTTDFTRDKVATLPPTVFFMQGQRPSGESFSTKFELSAGAKVSDLLEQMGRAMGNTDTNKVVEVSINKDAQIQMTNLQNGNEMMSFSIFGLTAQEGTAAEKGAGNLWDTTKIRGTTSLEAIKKAVNDGNVHLTSFISSPNYVSPDDGIATATDYDKVNFANKGATVQNNTSQIVRKDNSFATNNTRLSEVAGLSSGQIGAVGGGDPNAAGTTLAKADNLILDVTAKNGNRYKATIDFNGTQVTDPVTKAVTTYPTIMIQKKPIADPTKADYIGNFYKTFWNEQIDPNANPPRQIGNQAKMVETDDLSFKEINDMLTILANGDLDKMQGKDDRNPNTQQGLNDAYARFEETFLQASVSVESTMDHRGLITVKDKTTSATNIKIAMYQDHGGKDYPDAVGTANTKSASVLSFNKNDAVTIDRPSIDLFADLDDMIEAVFNGDFYGNANGVNPRTSGVQGAIKRLDHIMDHVNKIHAIAGTNSRHITDTNERATTLYLNVAEVKSSVIDADYGELAMQFQNNLLAYQAMLQASAKINQISLLNYM